MSTTCDTVIREIHREYGFPVLIGRDTWRGGYRGWRVYARISCNALDDLRAFRGFGILKQVLAVDSQTVVGRTRCDDSRQWDDRKQALRFGLKRSDYNPARRLQQ